MYVPAEHATSTIAIGRSGSLSSHVTSDSDSMVTARSFSSTVPPARATAYARRPPTLIAENAGGRCQVVPTNAGSADSTASRLGAAPVAGVISPSRSSVDDDAPKQIVAR